MGYISDFGTKSAALTLVSASSIASLAAFVMPSPVSALAPANASGAVTTATLALSISGLRSEKGDVLVCLSGNAKHFPDCSKDKAARKMKVAADKAGNVTITGIKPGTYAVALVHDENANGKMDLRLFLPREGFGFSRNPKIGMGPPKFKSAQFKLSGDDAEYAVKMKYIL